jgi:voltage-gated potassium channel
LDGNDSVPHCVANQQVAGADAAPSNYGAVDARSERIAHRFELPMLVAALLVIPLLVLEQSDVGEPWDTVAVILNWGTWLAFATELVVMLAVVPDRRSWLRDHPVEVISTVLTPPFLPATFAAVRLLRLLRLLRLAVIAPRLFTFDGVRYIGLLAFMTVLIGGTAFAQVEKEPDAWDGVWWAITTMTTVGYGDIYPSTDAGRAIAITVMLVGIGFGSVLIGAVAERFVQRDVAADTDAVEVAEDEVLRELRDISTRLQQVEAALDRRDAAASYDAPQP